MGLERMLEAVESCLFEWGKYLVKGPRERTREEADRLTALCLDGEEQLATCRDRLEQIRVQVRDLERQSAHLSSRIQSFMYVHDGPRAWEHALELDTLRKQMTAHRKELRRLLQVEKELMDWLAPVRRRLQEIETKLCSP